MAKSSGKDPIVSLARYSEIGFVLPAAVLLGFFLGKLLDYWLHTKWLYLAGLLFGAVVGFSQVIRMAIDASKSDLDSGPNSDRASAGAPSESSSGSAQKPRND
jgi:F0F1-type ATP synthase assembly protein I